MNDVRCPHCGKPEEYQIEEFPLPSLLTDSRYFYCNVCGHCHKAKKQVEVSDVCTR